MAVKANRAESAARPLLPRSTPNAPRSTAVSVRNKATLTFPSMPGGRLVGRKWVTSP